MTALAHPIEVAKIAAAPADAQVLIVDDLPANLDVLCQLLEGAGYRVLAAPSGEVATRIAAAEQPDLILLDVMMPGLDGFATCRLLKSKPATAGIPVLFLSARDETESVVIAFETGAVDYITKPFIADEVLQRVRTHLQISRLTRDLASRNNDLERRSAELTAANESLRSEIARRETAEDALQTAGDTINVLSQRENERWGFADVESTEGFVGRSKLLRGILSDVRRIRNFGSINVLITGESGTGKELVARAIHFGSNRSQGPFIPVNCVAIPEELAESMLFGHVRGAFTGATMDRKGFFEMAHGGTLFLDEIGDMPVSLQAKLLRVLEDGKVMALGSSREKQVDVRIVAATNADLASQIDAGSFRQDLYFRLAQYSVEVPPLRERKEDVPMLAKHFIAVFAREMGITPPDVDPAFFASLATHDFPGNVRELKNIIERALIESGGETLCPPHLRLNGRPHAAASGKVHSAHPQEPQAVESSINALPLNLEEAENFLIRRALAETGGNIAEAARRLGVNRTRIYRKLGEGVIGKPS